MPQHDVGNPFRTTNPLHTNPKAGLDRAQLHLIPTLNLERFGNHVALSVLSVYKNIYLVFSAIFQIPVGKLRAHTGDPKPLRHSFGRKLLASSAGRRLPEAAPGLVQHTADRRNRNSNSNAIVLVTALVIIRNSSSTNDGSCVSGFAFWDGIWGCQLCRVLVWIAERFFLVSEML